MMIIILILAIIFLIFCFLFLILILDSLILNHDLPTSRRVLKQIKKIILRHKPDLSNFYDLGCGRGSVVLYIKKELPLVSVYGLDKNLIRLFFARIKSKFLGRKINIISKDIFDYDFRKADVLYTYLWYDLMPILEKKLQKELKPGAIVITNTSHFSNWQPIEIINTWLNKNDFEKLFVYKK